MKFPPSLTIARSGSWCRAGDKTSCGVIHGCSSSCLDLFALQTLALSLVFSRSFRSVLTDGGGEEEEHLNLGSVISDRRGRSVGRSVGRSAGLSAGSSTQWSAFLVSAVPTARDEMERTNEGASERASKRTKESQQEDNARMSNRGIFKFRAPHTE